MAIKFEPKAGEPKEEKTYKIGDTFMHISDEPYIINRVGVNKVILSCMIDGTRWQDPISVTDDACITQKEFDELIAGDSSEFTPADFELKQI